MTNRPINYATRSFTVAAGATIGVVRQADFVACLAATSTFKIAFDDGAEVDFDAGLTYTPGQGFSRLSIRNPGTTPLDVQLGIGAGNIRDGRVTLNSNQTLPTRESAPDVLTAGAAVSAVNAQATELAAANSLRREILLVNTDAGATIYVTGDSTATAGTGIPVGPGQSLTLETSAAIYARNDSGAAVNVAVAEMAWSV